MEYLEFELEIEQGSGHVYPVAVLKSPAGQVLETMRFPFSQQALENELGDLQDALLHSGQSRRGRDIAQDQPIRAFGQALFDALFTGEVHFLYDASRYRAAEEGKGLRLKLRIHPPELAALPWEFLYDAQRAEYLGLSPFLPICRYVEQPQPIPPSDLVPPLRVLGMIASGPNVHRSELEREKQCLDQATQRLRDLELLQVEWVEGQSWRDLVQAFGSNAWHAFHFAGDGGRERSTGEGFVVLADDDGERHPVSATRLGRLLASQPSVQLVWLSAGQKSQRDERDRFSSTAALLVQRGIPAVITTQFRMSTKAGEAFIEAFYAALAAAMPVDLAVAKARTVVHAEVTDSLQWGIPVLHTHSPDLQVFGREALIATARSRGAEALASDDFDRAITQFTLAAELGADPDVQKSIELAQEARRTIQESDDALAKLSGSIEAQADTVIQVIQELQAIEERLPESQAVQQLLLQVRGEASGLQNRLWRDGQRLMEGRTLGLTLNWRSKRMRDSIRLLEKAARLDTEQTPALREDLYKAQRRLSYLQNAQAQASVGRGRRLGIAAIVAAATMAALFLLFLAFEFGPTPTLIGRARPTEAATPSQTAGISMLPTHTPTATPADSAPLLPSPTATLAFTASSSAIPTFTNPTATERVIGTLSTSTATRSSLPTPTVAPTSLPPEEPGAEPTPLPDVPSVTAAPTVTPTTGIAYPAPRLLQPDDVVFLSQGGGSQYVMRWEWAGALQADEWFDIRVWQEGMPHYGIAWTKQPEYVYDICQKGSGHFYWSIAVIRGHDGQWLADLSPEAPPRRFSSSMDGNWCR